MPSDPRPIEHAPIEGRRLLGELLQQRRAELGYTHRPRFTTDRLPPTPSGNPNTRLVADIEEAYRDNFPPGRLRQIAHAYLVTYESLVAVAHMKARALEPEPGPEAAVDGLPPAPIDDSARESAVRPYADRIWRRLLDIRGGDHTAGAQLFPRSPADAKAWDGTYGRMDLGDRVWLVADLQHRDGNRNRNGTAEAG